jgi:hypothetical protein
VIGRLRATGDLLSITDMAKRDRHLAENDLVEFDGTMGLWPKPAAIPDPPNLIERIFGEEPERHRLRMLDLPRTTTAVVGPVDTRWAAMTLVTSYLTVTNAHELSRHVTVIGQVEAIPGDGEAIAIYRRKADEQLRARCVPAPQPPLTVKLGSKGGTIAADSASTPPASYDGGTIREQSRSSPQPDELSQTLGGPSVAEYDVAWGPSTHDWFIARPLCIFK